MSLSLPPTTHDVDELLPEPSPSQTVQVEIHRVVKLSEHVAYSVDEN